MDCEHALSAKSLRGLSWWEKGKRNLKLDLSELELGKRQASTSHVSREGLLEPVNTFLMTGTDILIIAYHAF